MTHLKQNDAMPGQRQHLQRQQLQCQHLPALSRTLLLSIVGCVAAVVVTITAISPGAADRQTIERGKSLVVLGGCNGCDASGPGPAAANETPPSCVMQIAALDAASEK